MLRPAGLLPPKRLSTPRSGPRDLSRSLGSATRRSDAYRDGTCTRWIDAARRHAQSQGQRELRAVVVTAHHVTYLRSALLHRDPSTKTGGLVSRIVSFVLAGSDAPFSPWPDGRRVEGVPQVASGAPPAGEVVHLGSGGPAAQPGPQPREERCDPSAGIGRVRDPALWPPRSRPPSPARGERAPSCPLDRRTQTPCRGPPLWTPPSEPRLDWAPIRCPAIRLREGQAGSGFASRQSTEEPREGGVASLILERSRHGWLVDTNIPKSCRMTAC